MDRDHLDSTQAMASALLLPLIDEPTGLADARLLQAIGVAGDGAYSARFRKVLDCDEDTTFDFHLEGPAERKIFFELRLDEPTFGSCSDDPAQCVKLEQHYLPHLLEHVDLQWLERQTFCRHYQILRNVSYLGRYPGSGLVFIFPKANEALAESENAIKRIVSKSLAPRVAILYLEYLVARLLTLTEDDPALHEHYLQFRRKFA